MFVVCCRSKTERKQFFFEKKNQKTFASEVGVLWQRACQRAKAWPAL
jgi:hypothetical protein